MVAGDNIKGAIKRAQQRVLAEALVMVQDTIDNYLSDLEQHIGKIPGESGYADTEVAWAPLDEEADTGQKFWYETGAVAKHIVSKVVVDGNRISAMAGLPSGAPGYQEALWNEFGWSPHGSSKVVKRALFTPLGEHHLAELNAMLVEKLSKIRITIRVKA